MADRTAELEARMARLEQQVEDLAHTIRGTHDKVLEVGPISLDLVQRSATVAGINLRLLPREFTLLAALARRPGELVTNAEIVTEFAGGTPNPSINGVRVHLKRVRDKLDPDIATIITHRGLGMELRLTGR